MLASRPTRRGDGNRKRPESSRYHGSVARMRALSRDPQRGLLALGETSEERSKIGQGGRARLNGQSKRLDFSGCHRVGACMAATQSAQTPAV
jgi:hypothetical protein